MDDETHLLSRLAANYLYLAQFEPLRAVLVTLSTREPDLALAVYQTIVARSGRFESVLWSTSCPSSSLLTYLATLELLQFRDSTSAWSFGPETLRLRVEFLLLAQILRDQASEATSMNLDLDVMDGSEGLGSGSGELGDCVRVLDRVLELGVKRLRADGFVKAEGCGGGGGDDGGRNKASYDSVSIEEAELMCLRWVVLESADVYDALCWNAQRQIREWEGDDDTGMAITVRKDGEAVADSTEEDDLKVLGRIQRSVQVAHLDAIKECVKDGNVEGAVSRIRFLHVDFGVEEEEYSSVLQDLLKKVLSSTEGFGDAWNAMREKLLWIYREALASNSRPLIQMIEVVQDKLLSEDIECMAVDDNQVPLPVERFHKYMAEAKLVVDSNNEDLIMKTIAPSCMRDLYQHARVSESHLLECVMDSALSAVKREQLQEASNILMLFPQLQPLVASMGWDLLSGKAVTRRKLMQLIWISKSQLLRLEEPPLYGSQSDKKSCVDHLCDSLCYELDLASFVSCVNSGQPWNLKSSLLLSEKQIIDMEAHSDPFVENFVLERLSAQSPLRVLFDVVPGINFQNAIELISMQPITSAVADWKGMQDVELMHMHYALESVIFALGSIGRSVTDGVENHHQLAFFHLKDLGNHLKAVNNIPRKILMVNVIISLLHMDMSDAPLSMTNASAGSCFESPNHAANEGGNKMVISFTRLLLDILSHNLPTTVVEQEHTSNNTPSMGGRQALQWRISIAKRFMEDWRWRLSILQRLLPLSERQWRWKEALAVLRAAPSKLLNLCLQRAKYDIGGEAVQRFSLSAEDKATLELAEWVDSAFGRASVEDKISRAAEGTSLKDLDFHSLQSQLGPFSTVLLCIDVAATSARTSEMSQKLLNQAQVMLSEIYPGGSPKVGSNYWDQIHEVGVISVSLRVIKHLIEFLEQDNPPSLQSYLAGKFILSSSKDSHQQGQRVRAHAMLQQMIEDAHMGKRQFLSGKLHNLARAIADEETDLNCSQGEDPLTDCEVLLQFDKDGVIGLGLGAGIQKPSSSTTIDTSSESVGYDIKHTDTRLFGSLSTKATTYLSRFILHIAAIGGIVDGTDTTHDFNFFSLIYEWPKDLLSRLVFDRCSTDAAEKVAEIMNADFVHEVISACVPPVYPPRSGNGWACIPVIPNCPISGFENEVLSPSSEGAKSNCYTHTSAVPGVPLSHLQLDIVRHLVRISPMRAVLVCVFGSSKVYICSDSSISSSLNNGLLQTPDADRLFYEFALDQSERFPTLNRWIQMQTNLHQVSGFAVTPEKTGGNYRVKPEARAAIKRHCEHESDADSNSDDIAGSCDTVTGFADHQVNRAPERIHDFTKSEGSDIDSTLFLSFNWENEEPYQKAVERLINEGKLIDALTLSDRFLHDGASDHLLRLLIECEEENNSITGPLQSYGSHSIWSTSWQYCLRLKDKQLAAGLALKYMHRWELDAALDVLTMCSCHLPEINPIRNEVLQTKQALQRYRKILSADDYYRSWQEVELECKVDPEGLALRLAGQGAVSAALEVAESAALSIDLRRDLQGRQLVKLLTADPLSGGGPAEASRFLSSLCDSDDASAVAMGAMQLLPNLRSKQLLVHFFLKRKDGNLSDIEVFRLNSWSLGLRVLAALPLPWQQRCSSLHEHPHLILEVLLMRKQLQSASMIIKEFPSLRDNTVIIAYAAKAISINISSHTRDPRLSISWTRTKLKRRKDAPRKSTFSSDLSNLQKEARRAFSWAPRNASEKAAPKDVYRKRKSSGLPPPEKVAWETMTGTQGDRLSSLSPDVQERPPSVGVAEEWWMLTGDPIKNEVVRSSHQYSSAPDIILFKELLSLCSDECVSAKSALKLCIDQMKNVLSAQQLPENASMEKIGLAYHATETFQQGLLYAKSLIRKLIGGIDSSSNAERSWDAGDAFSDAGSSSVDSQSIDELSKALSRADTWLGHAELLQSLLGSGIAVSLDDVADKESSAHLCHRLTVDEKYSMAVYTCKKCKIDVFPAWNAWGHALIRTEHYAQARVKFKQALQLHKGDAVPVVLEIINTIEGCPPVDVSAVWATYEHFATRAPTILDDSLSADSYLNVLYIPSTFPRSEKSRRSQESSNNASSHTSYFEDAPRSNLDGIRYLECVHYLQEYARQHLLDFMFKHGHFNDACCLFFPLDTASEPFQSSSPRAVTSSPQRSDPSSTDYGSIDDLCDLSVGYNAMSVLEEVISTKMASTTPQEVAVNQYMDTALSRICIYCETHKHFNYLYKFQVIKKDHVAAGLCCIQLFMNSSSQEEAIKHLENAKMHFDEALNVRSKGGNSMKLVTRGVRGKSASEKLSEEGLVKFSARVKMQVDVVKSFSDLDGFQWKHSIFGNPNDHETFRRRCVVAETLVEKNFDLAFQVIYEFNLPAVDIYAGVASALAEKKKGSQLTEFLRNIKGTIDDDDWDQVLGAAINVYSNKHKERPDRLIDMLTSSHRKVLACVGCGRLKTAFQIASRSGSVADVQYVAHQAQYANSLPVLDMCKQWLAQYM